MRINFTNNTKLKGTALLLAILSWGIVKQITNNDKTIDRLPISIVLPDGWAIREQEVSDVQITFRGTREDLLLLDKENVQVSLDLRETEFEPLKTLTIRPRQVAYTGSSARITSITPNTFSIRLGKEGKKQVPVVVSRNGEPPEGVKLEGTEVAPGLVTLYGEEDLLESINSLQTSPIQLVDRIQSFEQRVDVLLPNEEWVGRIEPQRVQVRVTLVGLTEERKFEDIPLLLYRSNSTSTDARLESDPEEVDIFLKGSPQILDELEKQPQRIKAFVSADQAGNASIQVLVPPGIETLAVRPNRVRLSPAPMPTPLPAPAEPVGTPQPEKLESSSKDQPLTSP